MPTAYTCKLMEEGQAFPDFALLCARAMGATVMMREQPLDLKIQDFKPSNYSMERLEESKAELARLLAMDDVEKFAFGQSKKDEAISFVKKWSDDQKAENARLIEMIDKVHAWQPPTSDHDGLKKFMIEQLETSMHSVAVQIIDAEGRSPSDYEGRSPSDYYDNAVKAVEHLIEYHTRGDREERERTDSRNKWVRELKESLTSNL